MLSNLSSMCFLLFFTLTIFDLSVRPIVGRGGLFCPLTHGVLPYLKLSGSVNRVGKAVSRVFLVNPLIGV